MKLSKPYVWKSGLVALGLLSVVSLQSVSAQSAATTPSAGNGTITTPANGAGGSATNGGTANGGRGQGGNDNGGWGGFDGPGMNNGNWSGGHGERGGRMKGNRGNMPNAGRSGRMGTKAGVAGVNAQTIATFLGLTTEQLKADLDAGQSLSQIAVAQGKTRDELRNFLIQQATTQIDAAIDATVTPKSNPNDATTSGANATPSSVLPAAPTATATPTS